MQTNVVPINPAPALVRRPVDVVTDELDQIHDKLLELAEVVLSGVLGERPEQCIAGMLRVIVEESTVRTALELVDAAPVLEVGT